MAEPPSTITTVNGRRCTRVRRTSTLLADNTSSTSPATSTAAAVAPGTQTTAAPATTVPPLSSTEAASPVPALSSSSPTQPDASQSLSSELATSAPAPSAPAQSSFVSAGPSQSSSVSSPSTRFAVATTATASVAFISSDSSSSFASSTALNTLPSSTIPVTTTAQSGSSDTLTAVVSVVSSSTFIVSQPTTASESTSSLTDGTEGSGLEGSGTSSHDGHSSDHHSYHGLSPGAIAGIVLGVVFGIAAIIALILFCLKRRKERRGELNEKSAGEGGLAGTPPRSGLAAKWAALTAGLAAKAGLKPSDAEGMARRAPESPAFEPVARSSYSSAGSTRHLRSASAPAPPASRFAAFKQKFQKPRTFTPERKGRAMSTDSIPSFYSPTPPQLEDLPESLNPFRDPVPSSYRVTNPDRESLAPKIQTPQSALLGGNLNDLLSPLTPGMANWREPTPQFGFPASSEPQNPFLDPRDAQKRISASTISVVRRNSMGLPPVARVASHARSQSGNPRALSQARSSWYSEDSGYVSPSHPSAYILPLRPPRSNPFADTYASDVAAGPQQEIDAASTDSASIYILPASRNASVDSGRGPPGPIPLPSARSSSLMVQSQEPLATTSTARSSWLSPNASPAISYGSSGRSSPASGRSGRRRTAASRATRGKSDPFDLDRPEILAIASNYDPGKTPPMPRHSNGSDWWKEIVDEGTGSGSDFDSPNKRVNAYGLAR